MPNSTADVGGWEDYGNAARPADFDTDHDGLPNWWEQLRGLNTNSPAGDFSDANADLVGDGYTELDRYLAWMAAPHLDCPAGSPVDIDLTALTRGFTNTSPVYAVFNATNGTVTLNNRLAHFTPTVTTNAIGGFTFSVVDAKGYSLTNSVGVHIVSASTPPAPPVLGIRIPGGNLLLELTGENGRSLTVQTKIGLNGSWLDWSNLTGNGAMQLLPLNDLTNQSPRFFRALAQ